MTTQQLYQTSSSEQPLLQQRLDPQPHPHHPSQQRLNLLSLHHHLSQQRLNLLSLHHLSQHHLNLLSLHHRLRQRRRNQLSLHHLLSQRLLNPLPFHLPHQRLNPLSLHHRLNPLLLRLLGQRQVDLQRVNQLVVQLAVLRTDHLLLRRDQITHRSTSIVCIEENIVT